MPGRFKFEKLAKYPHMKPEDVAVWERFLEQKPVIFETVDYDFKVGEGQEIPEGTPENVADDLKGLSQRKIDVVGYRTDEIWIIEVKPVADMRALGQVISYQKLYLDQEQPTELTRRAIVCGQIENDMREIFNSQDVNVFVV